MSSIDIIVTDRYKGCCIIRSRKTTCKARPKWQMPCSRLLSDTIAGIMIWTISLIGSFLNVFSLFYTGITLRKTDTKQTKQNYAKVIILLARPWAILYLIWPIHIFSHFHQKVHTWARVIASVEIWVKGHQATFRKVGNGITENQQICSI